MMDITIERTIDETYIKSVLLNPSIYGAMCDDTSPKDPADLLGADIKAVPGFFLRALIDNVPCGVFWAIWKGNHIEAHTALLENCRGTRAIKATKAAFRWVFSNTDAAAVDSYAWSDCPSVKWFCRAVGLREGRTEKWPNTRKGKPVDITYFSIERGAF